MLYFITDSLLSPTVSGKKFICKNVMPDYKKTLILFPSYTLFCTLTLIQNNLSYSKRYPLNDQISVTDVEKNLYYPTSVFYHIAYTLSIFL